MCNLSQGIVDDTKAEIILNMFKKGYTLEQIADVTEKSISEIEKIVKKEEKKESCQKNIPQNTPKKKPLLRRVLLILGIFAAIIFGMMSCLAPKM